MTKGDKLEWESICLDVHSPENEYNLWTHQNLNFNAVFHQSTTVSS